ncbi:MAG: hypothetical protein IPL61_28205 [Myxococcales bacterium]|nr:hypothetical protein [Myxococcales bacterium]
MFAPLALLRSLGTQTRRRLAAMLTRPQPRHRHPALPWPYTHGRQDDEQRALELWLFDRDSRVE